MDVDVDVDVVKVLTHPTPSLPSPHHHHHPPPPSFHGGERMDVTFDLGFVGGRRVRHRSLFFFFGSAEPVKNERWMDGWVEIRI